MVDYWQLATDFKAGDYVQQLSVGLTPYVGQVVEVYPASAVLDVLWPFGRRRVNVEEVVRVNPEFCGFLPPSLHGFNQNKLAAKSDWANVPGSFFTDLAALHNDNMSEVRAYDELWRRYASFIPDPTIRGQIQKFYRFAADSLEQLIKFSIQKTAVYWARENRQHRATRQEVSAGRFKCPKCGTIMRRATYKMAEGSKHRLFACPRDLFLIRQEDVLGPDGNAVNWSGPPQSQDSGQAQVQQGQGDLIQQDSGGQQ